MKKFIIAAITVISFATAAFAADAESKAIALFRAAYPGASQVHYKTVGEVVSVSFVLGNTSMQAFFNSDGEQVAVSREVSYQKLAAKAQVTIAKKFSAYSVAEVIEMEHLTEGTFYYVSLVTDSQKVIVQVNAEGEVSVFKKCAR